VVLLQCAVTDSWRLQEMKQLKPGDRVLVMGCSSEPYLCAKKDEASLINFFQKHIHMPLPDYSSREIIWPGLYAKYGGPDMHDFDWPTLAQISQNYTSGQIDQVVASCLSPSRLECWKQEKGSAEVKMSEFINWLALVEPVSAECDEQLRAFAAKTPARAALAGEQPKDAKKPSSGRKGVKK
jgi:IQ and AAA domain-containing protein